MSGFLHNYAVAWCLGPIGTPGVRKNDDILHDPVNPGYHPEPYYGYWAVQDFLWPRSRFLYSGMPPGYCVMDQFPLKYENWTWFKMVGGTSERIAVQGQVVNSSGSGVSGVTVKLFDTPTNVMVDSTTTDANGNYDVGSYLSTNAFAIGYVTGSPDKAGTTINTIPA
jgi:hypothetical protein